MSSDPFERWAGRLLDWLDRLMSPPAPRPTGRPRRGHHIKSALSVDSIAQHYADAGFPLSRAERESLRQALDAWQYPEPLCWKRTEAPEGADDTLAFQFTPTK